MKIRLKIIYRLSILLLLFSFPKYSGAQTERQIRLRIEIAVSSYYNTYGEANTYLPVQKNKAAAFGFAISINKLGVVDTVIFTNKTDRLDSLISFNNITKMLKKEKTLFAHYKNTIMVAMVLVRRGWDESIENVRAFGKDFYTMMPDVECIDKSKNIKLLQSFMLDPGKPIR